MAQGKPRKADPTSLRNPMALLAKTLDKQAEEEAGLNRRQKREAAAKLRKLAAKEPKPE